jgi:pseudouridine kinase
MAEVIVVGGANVDIKGRVRGAYHAATSNIGDVAIAPGGVARNIAANLAGLGVATALIAAVGDDGNGKLIRERTAAAGVDVSMVEAGAAPTGVYLAILDGEGELVGAVSDMRACDALTVDRLEALRERLRRADFLIADCNLSTACLRWLCEFSVARDVRLLIEPVSVAKAGKLAEFGRPSPAFAITPNRHQLLALSGIESDLESIARLHALGFANVIVHCGGDGAIVSGGKGEPRRIAAFAAESIADVTGAGDAAVAGLVCGLLDGFDLATAARLGQAAAALKLRAPESVAAALDRDKVFALAGLGRRA